MLFSCLQWSSNERMNERTVGWSVSKLLGGAGSGYGFPYSILRMCWTGYQEDLYHYLHTLRRYCAPPHQKRTGVQYKYRRRLQRTGVQPMYCWSWWWSPNDHHDDVEAMMAIFVLLAVYECLSVCEYCRYVWHSMSIRHRHSRMSSDAANKNSTQFFCDCCCCCCFWILCFYMCSEFWNCSL